MHEKSVAEFLLEKSSTLDLLKNHILLSISFDKITDLLQENGKSQPSDKSSLQKLEGELSKNYNGFFNFASNTGTSGGGEEQEDKPPQAPLQLIKIYFLYSNKQLQMN